ncbi:MAG TPA: AraC family transcriptional regulator [Actinobacteria bacterium]|nr:AraC family transcriptional regulator [Actinomycetota bacterium]
MAADWWRYWRSADGMLEAMHAHFERHVYHRHSHETYSFGITEDGVQSFTCRGSARASATGMVMAFNPDDPHDGQACDELGFTYRIVHLRPELVTGVLTDITGRRAGPPLFANPVVSDPVLAGHLRDLHRALVADAAALCRDELLATAVYSIVRRAAVRARPPARGPAGADARAVARRVRQVIHDTYLDDITAADLAAAAGRSRFAVHRAFTSAYGLAPGDYQRQLRLRAARRLIAQGKPIGTAATEAGFSDQSHLTRWFIRCYGITPGGYQRAVRPHPHQPPRPAPR